MIWFNGKSGDDYHVIVERYPDVILPARKQEKVSVKGRNGDLLIQQDAFENVSQRYEIYISAERIRLPTMAHKVAEWLCVKGYHKLEDSYWRDFFRMASFSGGVEVANVLNRFGRATIDFDCKPQRFYKFGDQFINLTNAQLLHNPSPFTAKPLIVVQGSGAGTITDGVHMLRLTNCNNITIDCDIKQLYQQIGSVIVNRNSFGSGEFPELPEGDTRIIFGGGITSVKLKPRWWTI